MQFFSMGGEIKRQVYLPFITKRRNKKTKKNLWDWFRRDMNRWFYWERSMNIFQVENKNQMRSWGDWLIDSSLIIRKEGTWHTHKIGQKNYWRIRISILYFFYSNSSLSLSSNFLFRQCHCQKSNNFLFLFPSISAMSLPQTNCNKFFFLPSYFCNAITTNSFPQIFSPLFWPTNQSQQFFSLLFRQCHCHKFIPTIFFPSISVMPLSQVHYHKFSPLYFSNALPQINCHFFFFFEKWYVHIIFYNKS